jgi:hypothetical protein
MSMFCRNLLVRTAPEKESGHSRKVSSSLFFFYFSAQFTNIIIHILIIVDMETLQQLSVYVANFEKKSFKVDLAAFSSSVGPVGKKTGGY